MVIGENGIGKKSFINTLCEQQVYKSQGTNRTNETNEDQKPIDNTLFQIHTKEVILKKAFPIKLTINMTKNFGFTLNNSTTSKTIKEFLESKLEKKLLEEEKIERNKRAKDEIIHLMIMVINPKNKGLQPLEIELIKSIENKCNLLLVIGKADMLTSEELQQEKKLINQSIKQHNLKIYNFTENESDGTLEGPKGANESDETLEETSYSKPSSSGTGSSNDQGLMEYFDMVQDLLPFAIINGALNGIGTGDQLFKTRKALIGEISIEEFSDFNYLREIIFDLSLQEFKDSTNNIIYESHRTEKLLGK